MKKHSVKFLFLVVSIVFSVIVKAENVTVGGTISAIEVGWNGEGINIIHSGQVAGCNPNPHEFAISKDHPGYKELVSLVLAAHMASVNVQLVAESGTCLFGNRTKVVTVRLLK